MHDFQWFFIFLNLFHFLHWIIMFLIPVFISILSLLQVIFIPLIQCLSLAMQESSNFHWERKKKKSYKTSLFLLSFCDVLPPMHILLAFSLSVTLLKQKPLHPRPCSDRDRCPRYTQGLDPARSDHNISLTWVLEKLTGSLVWQLRAKEVCTKTQCDY